MSATPKLRTEGSSLKSIEDSARLEAIITAISNLTYEDLQQYNAWADLDELSSNTVFEGIEPHPDGIFQSGPDTFEAVATVYVTLQYGAKKDGTSMSDSYPATVAGRFTLNDEIKIDAIAVDTSSFDR